MRTVRTFNKPETIIITDIDFSDNTSVEPIAMVTDDESYFIVKDTEGNGTSVGGFGQIYIFTKSEFLQYIKASKYEIEEHYFCESIIIDDFVGDIRVTGRTYDGTIVNDFELDEFASYQIDELDTIILDIDGEHDLNVTNIFDTIKTLKTGFKQNKNKKLNHKESYTLMLELKMYLLNKKYNITDNYAFEESLNKLIKKYTYIAV